MVVGRHSAQNPSFQRAFDALFQSKLALVLYLLHLNKSTRVNIKGSELR